MIVFVAAGCADYAPAVLPRAQALGLFSTRAA